MKLPCHPLLAGTARVSFPENLSLEGNVPDESHSRKRQE